MRAPPPLVFTLSLVCFFFDPSLFDAPSSSLISSLEWNKKTRNLRPSFGRRPSLLCCFMSRRLVCVASRGQSRRRSFYGQNATASTTTHTYVRVRHGGSREPLLAAPPFHTNNNRDSPALEASPGRSCSSYQSRNKTTHTHTHTHTERTTFVLFSFSFWNSGATASVDRLKVFFFFLFKLTKRVVRVVKSCYRHIFLGFLYIYFV